MKVLVAEDTAVSLTLLEKWLVKRGYEAVLAANGEEAWRAFQENEVQMVLTDWMMPECDGLELCRRIRGDSRGKFVYIIVQTAKVETRDLVEALESGADDFIRKPIDFDELRARMRVGERIVQLENELAQRLKDVSQANERMRQDLEGAAEVQRSLLPRNTRPPIRGVQWASAYEPCEQVAGDIMNIFHLDERHIGLYLLDVAGHGVPAALFAVSLSRILSPLFDAANILKRFSPNPPRYEIVPPAAVAQTLNERFPIHPKTYQYFTLLYGLFDVKDRICRYALAGHPPPAVLIPGQEPRFLEDGDPPIGFFEEARYRDREICLPPGSRLVLYSDGVADAADPDGEMYGADRLLERLAGSSGRSLDDCLKTVVDDLRQWVGTNGFGDDVSLLAIES